MTLGAARRQFTHELALLVLQAESLGFGIAFNEGMDQLTAKDPTSDHRAGSLHNIGLAQDVSLYLNGVYLTQTAQYEALGLYWEARGVLLKVPLAWGGRFKDGNHFSLAWEGKK